MKSCIKSCSETIKILSVVCIFMGLAVIVVAGISDNYDWNTLWGLIIVFSGVLGFYTTSEKIRGKGFYELFLKDFWGLLGFGVALVVTGYFGRSTPLDFIINLSSPIILLIVITTIQVIAWRLGDWIFNRTLETTYADDKQG